MISAEESANSAVELLSPEQQLQAKYTEIASLAISIGQNAIELATRTLYSEPIDEEVLPINLEILTRREREVLEFASTGMSNPELATRLFVTEQTIKFHLSNVYRKLGVSNRTAAANILKNVSEVDRLAEQDSSLETLTRKERSVLTLMSQGKTNRQCADLLGVTDQTIKFHLNNTFEKLGVRNRTEAAKLVPRSEDFTLSSAHQLLKGAGVLLAQLPAATEE